MPYQAPSGNSEMEMYEDDALIRRLDAMAGKKDKLVRSGVHAAPADPSISVKSWRLNEFEYYKETSPFQTLARGLFTIREPVELTESGDAQETAEAKGAGRYRIVTRGYDKLFNIEEMDWTAWDAIEEHSKPPYELTVKANGCTIFIAALTPSKLLITSKHSMGEISGVTVSHAQKGEEWLHTHLHAIGRTTEQLAECLWNMKCTAVAELCDDSFEEHVLLYPSEKSGLHLHGINASTGAFRTLPSDKVQEFARQWGFIETPYITVETVDEVRKFTDEISKTGKWKGEPLEGFVVRCRVAHNLDQELYNMYNATPYPPGSPFFFKVKFSLPYMMYRDWREITKSLLSDKSAGNVSITLRSKLKRPETRMYYNWVKSEIEHDPEQFKQYKKEEGIIVTRERFLKWLESDKGQKARTEMLNEQIGSINLKEAKAFEKTIIVPVAIPGSGKTAVAVALKTLFDFRHVQCDDCTKKPFIQKVMAELRKHNVVIADKSNHMKIHRDHLRTMIKILGKPIRLLALNWDINKDIKTIHRICADRISERGDNHQTLVADENNQKHEEVLWSFIRERDELNEDEVDDIIDMEIEEELKDMVMRAVDACVYIIGLPQPSPGDIGRALAKARRYVPMTVGGRNYKPWKREKKRPVRYFGFVPEMDLRALVDFRLTQIDVPESARVMWDIILKEERVTQEPHITIVHMKEMSELEELWEMCQALFRRPQPVKFAIEFGAIVWNERMMALAVEGLKIEDGAIDADTGKFLGLLAEGELRHGLHVTVGTRSKDINAFEARAMVRNWRSGISSEGIQSLDMKDVVIGEVKGLQT